MTSGASKWRDQRDQKMPWRITVRRHMTDGTVFVDVHRFLHEQDADTFMSQL